MTDDIAGTCHECGASIYQEHLDSGLARHTAGALRCVHCTKEFEQQKKESGVEETFEPITFEDKEDSDAAVDMSKSRIHAATSGSLGMGGGWDDSGFGRPLDPRSISATRCRTFHSKITDAAIDYMNKQINEWIDGSESITIKFATSTIGVLEGKHSEPNLILTLFY